MLIVLGLQLQKVKGKKKKKAVLCESAVTGAMCMVTQVHNPRYLINRRKRLLPSPSMWKSTQTTGPEPEVRRGLEGKTFGPREAPG